MRVHYLPPKIVVTTDLTLNLTCIEINAFKMLIFGKKLRKPQKNNAPCRVWKQYIRKLFCLPQKIDKMSLPSNEWPLVYLFRTRKFNCFRPQDILRRLPYNYSIKR